MDLWIKLPTPPPKEEERKRRRKKKTPTKGSILRIQVVTFYSAIW
jgi:hypothetical protein